MYIGAGVIIFGALLFLGYLCFCHSKKNPGADNDQISKEGVVKGGPVDNL